MPVEVPRQSPWEPLLRVLGECDGANHGPSCDFMYMGSVAGPMGRVTLYKHALTRRYLALDVEGRPYLFGRGAVGIELWPSDLPEALSYALGARPFAAEQRGVAEGAAAVAGRQLTRGRGSLRRLTDRFDGTQPE